MAQLAVDPWVGLASLVAGVCLALALRGLSHPGAGRRSVLLGMIGMGVAVVATLATHVLTSDARTDGVAVAGSLAAIGLGAAIGIVLARWVATIAMPRLAAAFPGLVGLAASLVAVAAFLDPAAFGIADMVTPLIGPPFAVIRPAARIGMILGVAFGTVAASGSVVAFPKANGNIRLPMHRAITLGVLLASVWFAYLFFRTQEPLWFWIVAALALAIGILLVLPVDAADMPMAASVLNGCSGWAAAALGLLFGNWVLVVAGALAGASGAMLACVLYRATDRRLRAGNRGTSDRA